MKKSCHHIFKNWWLHWTKIDPSFYNSVLNQILQSNGTETTVSVNTVKTLTGETLSMSYLSPFTKGYIIIDPLAQYGTQPEIISFTGIDTTNIAFTGCVRGLSSVTTGSLTANKTYHGTGSPVIISWGAQNISDVITYLNSLISGANGNASSTVSGITKLSVNPVSSISPIAVGDNDIRVSQYTVDTGTSNTYAIAPSPAITSYTAGQKFSFKAINTSTGASTLNVNSLGTKTVLKNGSIAIGSGDIVSGTIYEVQYDGTNFQLIAGNYPAVKFGGTGADGIGTFDGTTVVAGVTPSGGVYTFNMGNVSVYTKNFTSIAITGTASVVFTNPNANGTVVVFKSQGNVSLTSSATPMIDASGLGSSHGNNAVLGSFYVNTCGGDGAAVNANGTAAASTGGSMVIQNSSAVIRDIAIKYPFLVIGSAGGNGAGTSNSGGSGTGGNGGNGGGCLIIECAGALNFTTTNGISVAGKAGTNGTTTAGGNGAAASAGGTGGSGSFICFYNILTANTGTVVSGATTNGTNSVYGTNSAATMGGGGSGLLAGTGASAAAISGGNTSYVNSSTSGAGFSLIALNTEFI